MHDTYVAENKALTRAKMGLLDPSTSKVGGNPVFYSSILFSLKQEWNDTLPTAAVNGKSIFINPAWFCGLKLKEQIGLLAHEVCHIGFQHLTTFPLYNRKKYPLEIENRIWNMAGDHVINLALTKAEYILPAGALCDDRFNGMTTFQVYCILHDEADVQIIEAMCASGSGDIIFPSNSKIEQDNTEKLQNSITAIIAKAKLNAELSGESIGSIPGEITRTLDKQINPRLPFEIILANYMSNYAKDDFSFRRPNRRYLPDVYLPGLRNDSLCNIACVFDVSGSVNDSTLTSFRNGLNIIKEELHPEKITLVEFDTKIRNEMEITSMTDVMNIKFHGGGGTDINPVIDWIKKNKPEITLIFSDGDFYSPDFTGVTTDIIWLIEDNPKWTIEYGRVFHYVI